MSAVMEKMRTGENGMQRSLVVIGLILLVSELGAAQTNAQRPPLRVPGKVVLQVTPTATPTSLIQLVRASSLIVDANITSHLPVINTSQDSNMPRLETHSVMVINSVFSGSVPGGSQSVLLAQVGGQSGNWDITAANDPLVLPGERYILFLVSDGRKELPNTSGMARYAVTGVWSGKIKVSNGKMAFAAAADADLHTFDGTDVNTFIQTLKDVIAHPYTNTQLPINFAQPAPKK